jgi:hypothetical protein
MQGDFELGHRYHVQGMRFAGRHGNQRGFTDSVSELQGYLNLAGTHMLMHAYAPALEQLKSAESCVTDTPLSAFEDVGRMYRLWAVFLHGESRRDR